MEKSYCDQSSILGTIERLRTEICQKERQLYLSQRKFRQFDTEISQLIQWITQVDNSIKALLNSRRWRFGNNTFRLLERCAFRSKVPMAADNIMEMLGRINDWKKEQKNLDRYDSFDVAGVSGQMIPSIDNTVGVSIIILNRNGEEHLSKLFSSFIKYNSYQPVEFIVVDHASSDNSLNVISSFQNKLTIRILRQDKNHSFSYSNNLAARQSKYEHLLFLNNDIVFESDILQKLINTLDDEEVGVAGVRLYYPDDHLKYRNLAQHTGIRFKNDAEYEFYRPYNLKHILQLSLSENLESVPAVTAALMLCRKKEFTKIGGFCEEYNYGYEDVDLCLTYRQKLNKLCVVKHEISVIHNEGSTQKKDPGDYIKERRLNNIAILQKRHGYALKRLVRKSIIDGDQFWTDEPFVVGFAVTEEGLEARAGDYFTALELGSALNTEFGWEIKYLARQSSSQDWYNLEGIDALIVMIDSYDLGETYNSNPSLIKICWMRNWIDRWAERESFDDYDIYLCSSNKVAEYIRQTTGKLCHVVRIATNEKRFCFEKGKNVAKSSDYCFTGNYWGSDRDIEKLDARDLNYKFSLYGHNWDKHESLSSFWKGYIPYNKLPSIYYENRIVIDDSVNYITKPWGSLNCRVFDAIASGSLVIINCTNGAEEIFGDILPTYESVDQLKSRLSYFLDHENERKKVAQKLREIVLKDHTYTNRAYQLKKILINFCIEKFKIAIKTPVPGTEDIHQWGDYHFALALKREFEQEGHSVRIDILPDWYCKEGYGDDVVLVLRGLSEYEPRKDHINLMWNISHPDKVSLDEYEKYDHVFIASEFYAKKIAGMIETPVTTLYQCADPNVFFSDPCENYPNHEILFVGNSRKQYRQIVKDAISADLPIAVYGAMWEGIIPQNLIKGIHIINTELRKYYSNSTIVLNDHWPSMRDTGFISNRIFDAAACGSLVVSDKVKGLDKIFSESVLTYDGSSEDLKAVVNKVSDTLYINLNGNNAQKIVLENHTFAHRAKVILGDIEQLDSNKIFLIPANDSVQYSMNAE